MGLDVLPLLGVTALVMAVPGPSVLYAVTERLRGGRGAGVAAVLGLETGLLIHVLAACLGVSALIAASPSLLAALRYAGAGYLMVLGLRQLGFRPGRLLRHPGSQVRPPAGPSVSLPPVLPSSTLSSSLAVPLPPSLSPVLTATAAPRIPAPTGVTPVRLWSVFRAGLLIDLLNPKTVLFFLALLPQFVPGGGLTPAAAAVLVTCVVGLGFVFDGGYAAVAGGWQRLGRGDLGRWGPRLTGGCFLALAVVAFLG